MITGQKGRDPLFVERAIESFQEQSYPEKELVIINHGSHSYAREGITEIKSKDGLKLGEYRNIALAHIPENEMWVIWDDDDWKHHKLIEKQYQFILSNNIDGCILDRFVFWVYHANFIVNSPNEYMLWLSSTIMCRNKRDVAYPPIDLGEDGKFFVEYGSKYQLRKWDNPSHYFIRLVHGINISDVGDYLSEFILEKTNLLEKEGQDYISTILPKYSFLKKKTLFKGSYSKPIDGSN